MLPRNREAAGAGNLASMPAARLEPPGGQGAPDAINFGIAIPFYRDVDLLSQALESVVAQTDTGWRCVVVDDCSPEAGVRELVAGLGDSRVDYVRNPSTLGVAGNFQRCFELLADHVGANIVAIVHGDDLVEPDFVEVMKDAHRRHPTAAAIAGRVTVIDAEGRPHQTLADRVKSLMWPRSGDEAVLEAERGLARMLTGQFWYCPAMSYRMDRLPDIWWDTRWHQVMDLDLYGRLMLAGERIVLLQRRVYLYRRHGSTMTAVNTDSLLRFHEEAEVSDELAALARGRHWRCAASAGRLRLTSRIHCLITSVSLLVQRRPGVAWESLRLGLAPRATERRSELNR